jgi:hypothetical protein
MTGSAERGASVGPAASAEVPASVCRAEQAISVAPAAVAPAADAHAGAPGAVAPGRRWPPGSVTYLQAVTVAGSYGSSQKAWTGSPVVWSIVPGPRRSRPSRNRSSTSSSSGWLGS